jgi:hypothetical protein
LPKTEKVYYSKTKGEAAQFINTQDDDFDSLNFITFFSLSFAAYVNACRTSEPALANSL